MCWGFPVEWTGVFPVTATHQGLQFILQEGDNKGVEGVDKVPQLFFFSFLSSSSSFFNQAVTLNECLSGPKQEWLLSISNDHSNNFIGPSNGQTFDKWVGKADSPISKQARLRWLPGNFRETLLNVAYSLRWMPLSCTLDSSLLF